LNEICGAIRPAYADCPDPRPSDALLGRRNWTFLGSDRGGKTMAILRSFVSSCELNKIDPFAWLQDVLARIPAHSIQKLDQLLPHNWATQTS
jgi:transposase